MDTHLFSALAQFAQTTLPCPDSALDTPWAWRDYQSEGIRFAHFRTYEELQALAVKIHGERAANGPPVTAAQRILAQYHTAYRDLQAILLGVDDETAAQPPAEGEWSVRTALSHIVQADLGFCGVLTFALEKHRTGAWSPEEKITGGDWDRILGLTEDEYGRLLKSPVSELQRAHQSWHTRILHAFAEIQDNELEKPAMFWEEKSYPVRFRLGRFASHMRQHTVQIEKTLAAFSRAPKEAKRLHRLLFAALAEVEGAAIGAWETGLAEREALAEHIQARAAEIAVRLKE